MCGVSCNLQPEKRPAPSNALQPLPFPFNRLWGSVPFLLPVPLYCADSAASLKAARLPAARGSSERFLMITELLSSTSCSASLHGPTPAGAQGAQEVGVLGARVHTAPLLLRHIRPSNIVGFCASGTRVSARASRLGHRTNVWCGAHLLRRFRGYRSKPSFAFDLYAVTRGYLQATPQHM